MGLVVGGLTLFILWMLLSGFFEPLLVSLGVASCLLVMFVVLRMNRADRAAYPLVLAPFAVVRYALWLFVEIIKSNVSVCRLILSQRMPIDPTVVRIQSTQKTRVGQVVFANSITLTPGTVSINLWEGQIRVHALTRDAANDLAAGEMDRRVSALERGA